MCIVEQKTYYDVDGSAKVYKSIRRCENAIGANPCSNVTHTPARVIDTRLRRSSLSETAKTSDPRPSSVAFDPQDIVTLTDHQGKPRVYRDLSRRTSLKGRRNNFLEDERYPARREEGRKHLAARKTASYRRREGLEADRALERELERRRTNDFILTRAPHHSERDSSPPYRQPRVPLEEPMGTVLPVSSSNLTDLTSEASAASHESSRPESSWKNSAPDTLGKYTFTDAVTTAPSANPPKPEVQITEHPTVDDFDGATQGLPPDEKRDYAAAFARQLKEALNIPYDQLVHATFHESKLPELLQDFAAMLKPQAGPKYHDAVKFIHRQRGLISELFNDPDLEHRSQSAIDDDTQGTAKRCVIPHHETKQRIEEWRLSIVGADFPTENDAESTSSQESLIEDSKHFLQTGLPWKWLTTKLDTLMRLSWQNSDWADDFLRLMPALASVGRSVIVCHIEWNPLFFLSTQYTLGTQPRLSDVVTVTGWGNHAQGMLCSEYVHQTWPLHGMEVLSALEDAIASPDATTRCLIDDDLTMEVQLDNDQTILTVQGYTPILVQVVAQMAWLGAVCTASSSPTRHCYTHARVKSHADLYLDRHCTIYYERDYKPPEAEHGCWYSLGRNMAIASGFPILARPQGEKGLEVDLELISALSAAEYATSFAGKFLLKGFSTMLLAKEKLGQSLLWHLVHNSDGKFLPYSAVHGVHCMTQMGFNETANCRHFVGWVTNAEIRLDVDLSGVRQPSRLSHEFPISLEKASVAAGKFITGGVTFNLGRHQKALYHTAERSFTFKIWEARQWHVVLYDTDAKRAWLEDGATALLHVTHGQLRSIWFQKLFGEFEVSFAKGHRQQGGDDSMKVLLDQDNMGLQLDLEVSETSIKREWGPDFKFTGHRPEQKLAQWTFRDHVAENFELLAKMRALQDDPIAGVKVSPSSVERLEGWSFRDLLDCRAELKPKMVILEPSGRGWEPFIRDINAMTLMGGNFGEIITPVSASGTCCTWASVPTSHDLLAVSYNHLKEIADYHRADDFPSHLTPSMQWHQPDALFRGPCGTPTSGRARGKIFSECGRIQVIISSWFLDVIKKGLRINLVKHPNLGSGAPVGKDLLPAVIFGRPRKNWLPGQPFTANSHSQKRLGVTLPQPAESSSHTLSTPQSKNIPLPSFSALSPMDALSSQTESSSSHAKLTPTTSGAEYTELSSATSISPCPSPRTGRAAERPPRRGNSASNLEANIVQGETDSQPEAGSSGPVPLTKVDSRDNQPDVSWRSTTAPSDSQLERVTRSLAHLPGPPKTQKPDSAPLSEQYKFAKGKERQVVESPPLHRKTRRACFQDLRASYESSGLP